MSIATPAPATSLQTVTNAALVGTAYFLSAWLSLHLAETVDGLATIWPASGVFVSALLLARKGQLLPLAGAIATASLAINLAYGASLPLALALTVANVLEGVLISQLIIRRAGVPKRIDDPRWLAIFLAATIVGSAASALMAMVFSGIYELSFFLSWVMTVCLGTLIVTPVIITMLTPSRTTAPAGRLRRARNLGLFAAGVAAMSWAVFALGDDRFLFLPVIGVVVAIYFFGPRGAAITLSLIALIAAIQTDYNGTVIPELGLNGDTLFLQFYLLSLLCAAWPLSVLISDKEVLLARYAETNAYLKLAEMTARVGHWHLHPDHSTLFWSEEVYRIHGFEPDSPALARQMDLADPTSLSLYAPQDREKVRSLLLAAMAGQEGFAEEARIIRPDGALRHVSIIGKPRFGAHGEFEGLFGTIQDITDQIATLEALQTSRADALREASNAQQLAETDELTGIANRRKIFADLDAAACAAEQLAQPTTIAIFDIDHFKAVNDQHGHQVGDDVLKKVARIAAGQIRPSDFIGRLGGEEFLVILPGEDGSNGMRIMERIRERIAAESWQAAGLDQVTVSAGIATFNAAQDIEDALQRADRALYGAKAGGRNLLRSAA